MRTMLMHIVFCCISILIMTAAGWADSDSWSQPYIDSAAIFQQRMLESKAVLEGMDPAEWGEVELADYQVNMGITVYNAIVVYCMENDGLPTELEDIVGSNLAQWPLNPQNNWEPVRVLGLGDGFSAGDIVYQECPATYCSLVNRVKNGTLTAQSFELSVYGPKIDHGQETNLSLANEDWGVIPEGAIISMGMYTEAAIDVIARIREREDAARLAEQTSE